MHSEESITLSLIVPTVGRPSLASLVADFLRQAGERDEMLVIGDGPTPPAREVVNSFPDPRLSYRELGPTRDWGHGLRNLAMPLACGTHLWSLDDDDRICKGAISRIRNRVFIRPDRPHVFRMYHGSGALWHVPKAGTGNISTQMFVVPNVPARVGAWGNHYCGDADFLYSTMALYPHGEKDVVFCPWMIAVHGIDARLSQCPSGTLEDSPVCLIQSR